MKNYLLSGSSFVFAILFATSCYTPRYVYSPSAHNVPVLTKKGDSKLGAVYSTNFTGEEKRDGQTIDNRSRGFDLHGAVAISDNFAVQANYFYRWEKSSGGPDTVTLKYTRNLTEIGLGYYLPVNNKKNVYFQFFAGAGLGKFSFTDNSTFGYNYHEANISKIYLQPAMLFRSAGSFTSSVSVRASFINYSKIKTSYTITQLNDYNLENLNGRAKIFIEPAFTGSFGFKNVPGLRFEFQGGLSFLMARTYVDYRMFNFSVGTWVDIGKLFSNIKS